MGLLELLGIPRVRVAQLSVWNFVGTFAITYGLVRWTWLGAYWTWFQLSCLAIPVAVATHSVVGEPTPLVLWVRRSWRWRLLMMILLVIGLSGPCTVGLRG